jgi:hypothetical protein
MERDPPRPEQIRALIEEVDRLCREAERVMDDADRAMKHGAFWPDRRKSRRPSSYHPLHDDTNGDAA